MLPPPPNLLLVTRELTVPKPLLALTIGLQEESYTFWRKHTGEKREVLRGAWRQEQTGVVRENRVEGHVGLGMYSAGRRPRKGPGLKLLFFGNFHSEWQSR